MRIRIAAVLVGTALGAASCQTLGSDPAQSFAAGSRPNILLITGDDLGFLDLGVYGSEIRTPNIDALAANGVVLERFYASVSCQPTRAMLHSGTDNHLAGIGRQGAVMPERAGWEGYLNHRVASVAERMDELGYQTYMTGKWHLGEDEGQTPSDRGFERTFVLLQGGADHFEKRGYGAGIPATYVHDGVEVESLPDDFYSSVAYADHMIEFIDDGLANDAPFFGYLSFTAPHWPIQALDEDLAKTRGMYDEGYDVIRERRFERWTELGFGPADAAAANLAAGLTPWDELDAEEQAIRARVMEAYAAMVERLDAEVGKVVDHLREVGELDNTMIVFLSDNGAEGTQDDGPFLGDYRQTFDNSLENTGRADSYRLIGLGWAEAATAQFFLTKSSQADGGTHVPAIVSAPGLGLAPGRSDALLHVYDLAPTFVELAGGTNTTTVDGREVLPMTGRSFAGVLRGEPDAARGPMDAVASEHAGQRAIVRGDWKALMMREPNGTGDWQLFNVAGDPGETTDLAAQEPALLAELVAEWDQYAEETGALLPESD